MNYYDKHIGDYIRDTVSLTMLEDGAYNRLLDQVYQTERPLPTDKKEVYRLARAGSTAERKAVDYVLTKFFDLGLDGYMQKRAQTQIEAYWDREPAEQEKRENAKIRQQRSRERRKHMFDVLRERGVTPEFNAKTKELEALLSRVTEGDSHGSVTCDDTLTQAPSTKHQTPSIKPKDSGDRASTHPELGAAQEPAPATLLSIAMNAAGVRSQPADPRLLALAEQGVTPETVTAACNEAKASKPNESIGPGYVVKIIERWAKEAAAMNAAGAAQPRQPAYQSANDKAREWASGLTGRNRHERDHQPDIIDINERPAGKLG